MACPRAAWRQCIHSFIHSSMVLPFRPRPQTTKTTTLVIIIVSPEYALSPSFLFSTPPTTTAHDLCFSCAHTCTCGHISSSSGPVDLIDDPDAPVQPPIARSLPPPLARSRWLLPLVVQAHSKAKQNKAQQQHSTHQAASQVATPMQPRGVVGTYQPDCPLPHQGPAVST